VRTWFNGNANRCVWAVDERSSGFGSKSLKHGDFDNDEFTVASVSWILQHGY
jgi:hypothetical protein